MESKNKKAQGMSVTTIILIVLGLFVLVALIVGFTMGWGNIKEWIAPSSNVDKIVQQCSIACGTNQKFSFCSEKRELKSNDGNLEDVTCYYLAEKKSVYGIERCSPAINCNTGIFKDADEAKGECKDAGGADAKADDYGVQYLVGQKLTISTCKDNRP